MFVAYLKHKRNTPLAEYFDRKDVLMICRLNYICVLRGGGDGMCGGA